LYDAKILTTLAVNTHNVLGSSHMKGDRRSRVYKDWEKFGLCVAPRYESFNICCLNIQKESRRRSKTDNGAFLDIQIDAF